MASPFDNIIQQFKYSHWLNRLIYINLGVFILFMVLQMLDFLFGWNTGAWLGYYTSIPSDPEAFILRPWTLVTYMFVHRDFWHILFNMLVLFFTGHIFMDFLGDKRVLPLFIMGGLAGALLYLILFYVSPNLSNSTMIGASAGVMAILVAAATKAPGLPVRLFFVLEVPFWVVAVLFILLDIAQVPVSNSGGHIAHLGGALLGYLYIQQLDRGRDWSNSFWNLQRKIAGFFDRSPRLKTVYKSNSKNTRPKRASTVSDQERMDRILDKIKKHGYDKLSKEEKDFLFQISRK